MKRLLLIDADVLVHKISRAAEKQVRWNNGVWTWFAEEQEALFILDNYMKKLYQELETEECVMCLSSSTNFRHGVYPDYKLNRDNPNSYPPILKKFLRDHFEDNYETYIVEGIEADDVLGILMTNENFRGDYQKVICTIDKDLDTIPGWHYNLDKEDFYNVTEDQADYMFHKQILTGDRVDGIPGCPGVGEVTAKKILDSTPRDKWYQRIVKTYESKGLCCEDVILNAQLVKILDNNHWAAKVKTPILWLPDHVEIL